MNLKNLFVKLGFFMVALMFSASTMFAADIYVNNTNGDDLNGDGSEGNPYATLSHVIENVAESGDVIYVAADEYNSESDPLVFDVDVTVIVETFQDRTDALFNTNLEVDADVSIAATGTNDFRFDGDLDLTSGALTIDGDNFLADKNDILVTVVSGTINETPTYAGAVNVEYKHDEDYTVGPELPADLDGGRLTNNPAAADLVLTVDQLLTAGELYNIAGDHEIVFTEAPTLEGPVAIDNVGTIDFQAGATVLHEVVNSGTIKLNDQTLHVDTDNNAVTLDNAGGAVISDEAQTIGDALIHVMGDNDFVITGGEIVSLEVPSVYSVGSVNLTGDVAVYGDFILDADHASAFADGGFDLQLYGDFFRDDDTPGNYNAAGTLSFLGEGDQTFDPGASLEIYDLVVDNNENLVTLDASIRVNGDVNIAADGNLELSSYYLRMLSDGNFVNDGSYISTSTTGYLVFQGNGTNDLSGAGDFSNIDIRNSTDVTLQSDVNFSGILKVRDGDLDYNGNDFNLDDVFVDTPEIEVYTNAGTVTTNGGDLTASTDVLYDLTFLEGTNRVVDGEWTATSGPSINDLNITTDGDNTVTGPGAASEVAGKLTVDAGASSAGEVLDLGASTLTLTGDNVAHDVYGEVTNGEIIVEGAGSSINGSGDSDNASAVEDLTVNLESGEGFTASDLVSINGDLVHENGSSSVTFLDDGSTVLTFAGALTLTDGELSLAMAEEAAQGQSIAGNVTLTAGKLTLGSDLTFEGTTDQVDADIDLQAYDLTLNDLYVLDGTSEADAGTISGTGKLVVVYSNAATANEGDFELNDPLSVSNLVIDAVEITQTVGDLEADNFELAAGDFIQGANVTVNNSVTLAGGDYDVNGNEFTFSGGSFLYEAGTVSGTGGGDLLFDGDGQEMLLEDDLDISAVDFELDAAGLSVVDNDGGGPYDLITGNFTQTAGDIAIADNNFRIDTDFTREAGSWSQGDGYLLLNGATVDHGENFAVDNLGIGGGAVTFPDELAWEINENLVLDESLDPGADAEGDPQLTFADGATIERQQNAATLADEANYDGDINLVYSTLGTITTSDEANATTINNMTAEVAVTMDRDVTVNGTLRLEGNVDLNGNDLFLADGATLNLVGANGTTRLTEDPTVNGTLNINYETTAGFNTTDRELGTAGDPHTIGMIEISDDNDLTLHRDLVINGELQFSAAGDFDLDGNTLTLNGGVDQSGSGWIVAPVDATTVTFGGSANTEVTLNGDWVIDEDDYGLHVNKDDEGVVTVTGGDIDFATNDATLYLVNGVLATGSDNTVILKQGESGGQATQGYDRTDGHIDGNVKKFIDRSEDVAISNVIFPVGTEPTSPANYRPAIFYFKNTPQSSFNLTVNHDDVNPNGSNGIPLDGGEDLTITNYPDFYWYVKSDASLSPSYEFDLELQAEGYDFYLYDEIEDVRMIRRDSGNVDNEWRLQGDAGKYDNSTINQSWPVVKVKDAEGGITTQGSKFTYSQSNKAPVFTAALEDTTIDEGDSLEFTYVAEDVDLDDEATMSAVTLPEGAEFDAETGDFSWVTDYLDAGDHEVTIRATDTYDESRDTTITITVNNINNAPEFVETPADTTEVPEGSTFEFTFTAEDEDPDNEGFTYSLVNPADSVSIVDTTGVLTFTPAFGDEGMEVDYTVRVTDSDGGTADTALTFVVIDQNRAPEFIAETNDTTVAEDQELVLDFGPNADDPDGDELTFSHAMETTDGEAVSDSGETTSDGVFTWTPDFDQAGTYNLIVEASDGVDAAYDTVGVEVTDVNAAPYFTETGKYDNDTVKMGDTFEFTYAAEDPDGDSLTFTKDNEWPDEATLTAVDDTSALFSWTPEVDETAEYVIKIKVSDGEYEDTHTSFLVVKVVTVEVGGAVVYNQSGDSLNNVAVTMDSMADTTAADGLFKFVDVSGGDYTLTAEKTDDEFGGVSSADALAALRYSAELDSLDELQQMAADVNNSGTVNATDALQILRRVVGSIDSFEKPDWVFASEDISVGNEGLEQNITGIITGDVNNSYSPSSSVAKSNVTFATDDVLQIKKEEEFKLPVYVDGDVELAGFNMTLSYPVDKLEFDGVESGMNIISHDNKEEGKISLAWVDLSAGEKAIEFEDGGKLFELKFKATEDMAKDEKVNLSLEQNGEMVNAAAKSINANISAPSVEIAVPDEFALSQNYPNPFNPNTKIKYDLPENGKVRLTIYNSLGQKVETIVNNEVQEAGYYEVQWNAAKYASGMYIYRITVEGSKEYVKTKKMMLLK